MQELLPLLPSREAVAGFFQSPGTWRQLAVVATGALLAWFGSRLIRQRLAPAVQPGAIAGVGRTAVRTGLLALTPLLLWLWLLAASAVMRRLGLDTDVLRTAMPLVGALALIRMGVFVLRHSLSPGSWLKTWEGTFTLTIWLLAALHILGWLPFVEQTLDEYAIMVGQVRVSIYTVISFALSVVLLLFIALWLTNAIQWRLARSSVLEESLKIAIGKIVKFAFLTIAVLAAMLAAGIDLTAFAVFGGALGVGLGLGLQRIVSNFVSGIVLAFEGSIRPGDVITIGQTFGTVQALHTRHVLVHTRDGLDILVPNENLLTQAITNWSYGDRNVRLKVPVQISYDDDPEHAIATLEEVARSHPRVLKDPPPAGALIAFGESGVDLELWIWVNDPERGISNVRSELNRAIWQALKRAGITIPYPQRDLHIKSGAAAIARSDET
jgi:small-conductance mechanosensitive channel